MSMGASSGHMTPQRPVRCSPFAAAWKDTVAEWVELHGMRAPSSFRVPGAAAESFICDLSFLPRTGVKGAGAAEGLRGQGIPVPERANQWNAHRGGIVARLGHTEFLLESGPQDDWTRTLSAAHPGPAQTFPVLRQDASLLLGGARVHDLLAQTCSFHFASLQTSAHETVMTQMIGVSIIALCITHSPQPAYRLWCDPSFADYLWRTLAGIVCELGGAPIGLQELIALNIAFAPDLALPPARDGAPP